MSELKKFYDDFNMQARIIPALIVAVPIFIYLIINNIINIDYVKILNNSMIFIIIIALYYRVIRNLGKKYEDKMYKELGGKPTTIVLRYSDNRIDKLTKTRYHKKLNLVIDDIKLPTKKENEKEDDDQMYESASNWLRNYANTNREKEQRVYQELKDYNFWRNLYGGKVIIIISCVVCIIIEVIKLIILKNIDLKNMFPIAIMTTILIVTCLVINKKIVLEKAFDYAITLMGVCERIRKERV